MTLPNFFVVGAECAGASSLHRLLDQHPQVHVCPVEEPAFFVTTPAGPVGAQPYAATLDGAPIDTLERYEALFEGSGDAPAIGEVTTSYLASAPAARGIAALVPDARIVAILRDPVDRAAASHRRARRLRLDPRDSFAEAIADELAWVERRDRPVPSHLAPGFYAESIHRYQRLFTPERVHVVLHADLLADAAGTMARLCAFLGVDPSHRAELPPPGSGGRPDIGDVDIAPEVSPALRRRLVELYRDDVVTLAGLLGRDLSAWLATLR